MKSNESLPIAIGITGASGVIYGQRLLEVLLGTGIEIHLTISESGRLVLKHELDVDIDLDDFRIESMLPSVTEATNLKYWHYKDFMTPIASGSHRTRAMVICPCSGSTLSGIASASSANLIQRAADVHLKEKRPLVLVPRETPLSLIQIENLLSVARAGATVLPASPGFYHGSENVSQLVDFVVARILDHLDVPHQLTERWGGE